MEDVDPKLVKRIENQSFMRACLQMAATYLGYVEQEIALYKGRKGHKRLECDFFELKQRIEKLRRLHKSKLDATLPKPKKKKKKVSPSSAPKKKFGLKKRG